MKGYFWEKLRVMRKIASMQPPEFRRVEHSIETIEGDLSEIDGLFDAANHWLQTHHKPDLSGGCTGGEGAA